MNTDRNGLAKEYDLATVRSDIATINSSLALQATNLATVTASLAALASKFEVLTGDVGALKLDVAKLKSDVTTLQLDVAVIKSNYVTKAELLNLEVRMLKWFIATWLAIAGSTIATAGTTFAIVKFFH